MCSPADIMFTPSSMSQADSHLKRILSFLQDAYAYINGQLKSGPLDEPALKKVRKKDVSVCINKLLIYWYGNMTRYFYVLLQCALSPPLKTTYYVPRLLLFITHH